MREKAREAPAAATEAAKRGRSVMRLAKWIVIVAVGLEAVYLGGANLVLNTTILDPVINNKREKLLVEWQAGSTVWPGRVHIQGLRIRGQARTMQWQMTLQEGDFQLSLLDLLGRKVHVKGGAGSTFSFVSRPRLDTMKNPPSEPPHWAEIEGLENPPNPKPEDLYPPKARRRDPWHIVVDQVTLTDTTSFFVGPVQISGQGTVDGSLDYRLRGGPLAVPMAMLDLEGVRFATKTEPLVEHGTLRVNAELLPHMRAEARGAKILSKMIGRFDLRGDIASLRVLNDYVPAATGLAFESGTGTVQLRFDAPSPEKSSGSVVLDLPDEDLLLLGFPIRADIAIESAFAEEDRVEGVVHLSDASVRLDNVYTRATWDQIEAGELDATKAPPPWWARFGISDGRLDLGEPSRLEAVAHLGIADTKPLLRVFADFQEDQGRKAPWWLETVPNITNLEGTMNAAIDENGTTIRDLELHGEGLRLRMQLHSDSGKTSGAMYIRFKGIPLGIELEPDGGKDLKLIRPRKWYEETTGATITDLDDEAVAAPPESWPGDGPPQEKE